MLALDAAAAVWWRNIHHLKVIRGYRHTKNAADQEQPAKGLEKYKKGGNFKTAVTRPAKKETSVSGCTFNFHIMMAKTELCLCSVGEFVDCTNRPPAGISCLWTLQCQRGCSWLETQSRSPWSVPMMMMMMMMMMMVMILLTCSGNPYQRLVKIFIYYFGFSFFSEWRGNL